MSSGEKNPSPGNEGGGRGDPVKAASVLGLSIILASLILSLSFRGPGRYQIGAHPGHVYVIDTITGQVWEKFNTEHSGTTDPQWKDPKEPK